LKFLKKYGKIFIKIGQEDLIEGDKNLESPRGLFEI
jgi:hypothetical protein